MQVELGTRYCEKFKPHVRVSQTSSLHFESPKMGTLVLLAL